MRVALNALTFLAAFLGPSLRADTAASANYSMAISFEAGGERSTSQDYIQNSFITVLSGRSIATFSDTMVIGFASRLNNPPNAVNDVRSHPQDAAINITASSLLANDFDPDGDTLALFSADATTARGGMITVNGQTINYAPPTGLEGPDSFNYSIADSNGDLASATVTLVIAPPITNQPLNTVSLAQQPDGTMLIRFRQQPGSSEYVIEFSHDLTNPDWQTLQDVHASADGIVELLIDPAQNTETFFRALVY